MGYTTEFKGEFKFEGEPDLPTIKKIKALDFADGRKMDDIDAPDSYCQWVLTNDFGGIEWNRSEKFYHYAEWLQFIIDSVLAPVGVKLLGRVKFQGESWDDRGELVVDDDQEVRIEKVQMIPDDLASLVRFRDWVLAHRNYGDDIAREYAKTLRD